MRIEGYLLIELIFSLLLVSILSYYIFANDSSLLAKQDYYKKLLTALNIATELTQDVSLLNELSMRNPSFTCKVSQKKLLDNFYVNRVVVSFDNEKVELCSGFFLMN